MKSSYDKDAGAITIIFKKGVVVKDTPISERTILRWIDQGKIPAKKVGKEYKINPEHISDLTS